MLISTEKEDQISNPVEEDAMESLASQSYLKMPPISATTTDVNMVPEHEVQRKISDLEEEIVRLRSMQISSDEKRRQALNKILDTKGCIRVFCRVRPLLSTNKRIHLPIVAQSEKVVVGSAGSRKEFTFDKVFPQEATQEDVFIEVKPVLRSALDGHNVCMLAYGQTGTGKTFTMDGTDGSPGLVLRAIKELFHQASLDSSVAFTFTISMLEVYLGNLRDLLAPKPSSLRRHRTVSKCNLNIQTDSKGFIEIEGLSEVEISDFTKANWWYTKGRRVRSTSWTNVNEASSRSHCLTRINIIRREHASGGKPEVSKLWMVDLGGSERLLKTGATGQTLDEGRAINLSLSALGDVIAALRRKRGHVPFRNSKLTQILKDSLSDGSKVMMLVHISQYEEDVGETTCSLSFAQRVRAVETTREITEELKKQKEKRIAELSEEMRNAEEEYRRLNNQIENAEIVQSEYKKLLSSMYDHQPLVEDEEGNTTPTSAAIEEEKGDIVLAPKTSSDKVIKRKISNPSPRFMNPTMASLQRHSAAERDIDAKTRLLRSRARSVVTHVSGSQSLSCSDPHFKALIRNSNKKTRNGGDRNGPLGESTKCNSMPRPSTISSSDPNLKATLSHHRRRMSDLI